MTSIEDAVRAWANGIYPTEAGVELLIRQRKAIYEGAPWLIDLRDDRALKIIGTQHLGGDRTHVAVDVDTLLNESDAWSGGEQRIVRIAASLLGGPPSTSARSCPASTTTGSCSCSPRSHTPPDRTCTQR